MKDSTVHESEGLAFSTSRARYRTSELELMRHLFATYQT